LPGCDPVLPAICVAGGLIGGWATSTDGVISPLMVSSSVTACTLFSGRK
jgi:hypothetical protein